MGGIVPAGSTDNGMNLDSLNFVAVENFFKSALLLAPIEESVEAVLSNQSTADAYSLFMLNNALGGNELISETTCTPERDHKGGKNIRDSLPLYLQEFLESPEFLNARRRELTEIATYSSRMKGCSETTLPELLPFNKDDHDSYRLREASASIFENIEKSVCLVDAKIDEDDPPIRKSTETLSLPHSTFYIPYITKSYKTLEISDKKQLQYLYNCNSWLLAFIAVSEYLPYSISLSQATVDRTTFPLIAVNLQFERVSGRLKSEMIGNPGTFLQTRTTITIGMQSQMIQNVTKSIIAGNDMITSLICSRRNGEQFHNLIGLKPIFVSDGQNGKSTKYVITIQRPLSSMPSAISDIMLYEEKKRIHCLLELLPNTV
mmetsp:Transcript_19742/g.19855  ORF Transcript_19742/g.19855 Transcript_19742/m.19855 type:complete len:375 (+) Transcript_19742:118-1242(+)